MRILIYGAGAVGCYLGGQLALAGHAVTLLGRQPLVEAVIQNGLTLESAGKTRVIREIRAASSLAETLGQGPFDWIAFTMKAYDTVSAIHEVQTTLTAIPPIACFQNGVGNEESLRAAFGAPSVVAATITTPISVKRPGVVVEEKQRGIALASDSPSFAPIYAAFRTTGLRISTTESSASLKWSKLLTNMLGNATSAILDAPPRQIFADRRLFRLEVDALREALAFIRLQQIRLVNLPQTPVRLLAFAAHWIPQATLQPLLARQVAGGRGDKLPSLLLALRAGDKRTEVAWLNGAVAQAASNLKRLAPINHALALIVSDITSGRVPWDAYRGQPEHMLRAVSAAQGMRDWRYGE